MALAEADYPGPPSIDRSSPMQQDARCTHIFKADEKTMRAMVERSEVIIAEASFPSTGLGIEMQIAESKGIPIILCFRDFGVNKVEDISYENPDHSRHSLQVGDGFVTLMALGVAQKAIADHVDRNLCAAKPSSIRSPR
jgi:hypothetical protein